jgi:hypothetical protein
LELRYNKLLRVPLPPERGEFMYSKLVVGRNRSSVERSLFGSSPALQ